MCLRVGGVSLSDTERHQSVSASHRQERLVFRWGFCGVGSESGLLLLLDPDPPSVAVP